ncbi:hypothetical protein [uncultured Spirosoma sp.]|uniref:hypothetical protein n=1 Tax=uncultured Spirosoma sp. TaxID=278208 RepID=UPI002586BA6A|nr:hypothetical protein [uncultured Spirosoma sp.]
MSTVIIHVPDEKKDVLINFLRSVPYVTVENDQPVPTQTTDWQQLRGAYAHVGITSAMLAQENQIEKERERNRPFPQ